MDEKPKTLKERIVAEENSLSPADKEKYVKSLAVIADKVDKGCWSNAISTVARSLNSNKKNIGKVPAKLESLTLKLQADVDMLKDILKGKKAKSDW